MKAHVLERVTEPSPATSFRLYLQEELARRCGRNARYSLRAFARGLGVDHSTLSQLLHQRRRLTPRAIRSMGARLTLDRARIEHYVESEHLLRAAGFEDVDRKLDRSARDVASAVADWQHHAILELTHLESFSPRVPWISRVLGITPDEVNVALARLLRLGLLRMKSRTEWEDVSGNALLGADAFREAALSRLQEEVHRLSVNASSVPARFREFSTTTLAVRTADIPAAIEEITRFRRALSERLDAASEKDDVYQLHIQLFPVTQLKMREENPDE